MKMENFAIQGILSFEQTKQLQLALHYNSIGAKKITDSRKRKSKTSNGYKEIT